MRGSLGSTEALSPQQFPGRACHRCSVTAGASLSDSIAGLEVSQTTNEADLMSKVLLPFQYGAESTVPARKMLKLGLTKGRGLGLE